MNNFFRNVLPALAIMVIGASGAYVIYDHYFKQADSQAMAVSAIEPASGSASDTSAATMDSVQGTPDTTTSATASPPADPATVTPRDVTPAAGRTVPAGATQGAAVVPTAKKLDDIAPAGAP